MPAVAEERQFLVISDFHFDPFQGLNKQQFGELRKTPTDKWPAFFARLKQPLGKLGVDSNARLVESALTAAAVQVKQPEFILYPGDFLTHEWQRKYNGAAAETIADNPQAYREFTIAAIRYLAERFRQHFPQSIVLPALGNDDSLCGDYWIQPNGDLLEDFARLWSPMLGSTVEPVAFRQSCAALGCYAADLPSLPNHRLVVLNSVFWSQSYCSPSFDPGQHNCCGCTNAGTAPGTAAMDWFEQTLAAAQQQRRTVWLLMHIPPGLDSYVEDRDQGSSAAAGFWTDEFHQRYLTIVEKYRGVLQVSFVGHTHMDDFRLDFSSGDDHRDEPLLWHKITPAVSPIFGNNPAFLVFQYDRDSGRLTNWQTHYLPLSDSAGNSAKPSPANWRRAYDAREAYELTTIGAGSIARLFEAIRRTPGSVPAATYRNAYKVAAQPINESHLPIFACAVLQPTFPAFRQCVQSHRLPTPRHMADPAELRHRAAGLRWSD